MKIEDNQIGHGQLRDGVRRGLDMTDDSNQIQLLKDTKQYPNPLLDSTQKINVKLVLNIDLE